MDPSEEKEEQAENEPKDKATSLDTDELHEKAFCRLSDLTEELKMIKNEVENGSLIIRLRLSLFSDGVLQRQSVFTLGELWIPSDIVFPLPTVPIETQYIYALWNCVRALSRKAKGFLDVHVPYRLSAVTRILQEALGGQGGKPVYTCAVLSMCRQTESYENAAGVLDLLGQLREIATSFPKGTSPNKAEETSPQKRNKSYFETSAETAELDEGPSEGQEKAAELRRTSYQLQTELMRKCVAVGRMQSGQKNSEMLLQEIRKVRDTIRMNQRKIAQLEGSSPHPVHRVLGSDEELKVELRQKDYYIQYLRGLVGKLLKERRGELTEQEKTAYDFLCGTRKKSEESETLPEWLQQLNFGRKDVECMLIPISEMR